MTHSLLLGLLLAAFPAQGGDAPGVGRLDDRPVEFRAFKTLPDPLGFGGPIAGSVGAGEDETLIVAGGANFPHGPPWAEGERPAGAKVWHDRTFFLRPGDGAFREGPRLPYPLAYAPCVEANGGLYVLGGETFSAETGPQDTAEVLRIVGGSGDEPPRIERHALPPLPKPCSYHAAGRIGRTLFVAASHPRGDDSRTLDAAAFWSLDLAAKNRRWVERPVWPGPPRHKMALAIARGPLADTGEATGERIYLISGSTWARDADGEHDLSKYRYFDDAFAFDPATDRWERLADLPALPETRTIDTSDYTFDKSRNAWTVASEDSPPADPAALFDGNPRPAAAASAIGDGDRVLLVSGSTGRYVTLPVRDRPAFPAEVLAYEIDTNAWSVVGRVPTPVVTTALVRWNGRSVLISGEVRPGVRTPLLQSTPAP
ncbi:kelch repeat-containing protein [Alienimonas chondri]|uniref:N-acetylneuraminate epimerase n=1 Tax=Alienimonas chondri TaxID=2681879 RepID=A0ABX1V771_9PLAN|nr:kelch repeat-containing protein [Alienimonas chondri]NNJ24099.1 N-acetylneuraminate epimerase [Alienimonas chondri]